MITEEERIELKDAIMEMPFDDRIRLLRKVFPKNNQLIQLGIRYRQLQEKKFSGFITDEHYDIEGRRIDDSLLYFLDNINNNDYLTLKNKFTGDNGMNSVQQVVAAVMPALLYVSAIPVDQVALQTDFEYKNIEEVHRASAFRDRIKLLPALMAATLDNFSNQISLHHPNYLHFSGHGETNGLVLVDNNNRSSILVTDLLGKLFETFNFKYECIFLNACYSASQADALKKYTRYIVGMNVPVTDDPSIVFSKSFYNNLFNDEAANVERAFNLAKIKLAVNHDYELKNPVLVTGNP